MLNDTYQSLWDVMRVALVCMMTVVISGVYYDVLFKTPKVEVVECSKDIRDTARKINITIMGSCEVVR